jgi:plastocyanin
MNLRRATLSLLTTAALLGGVTACGGGDDEPAAAEQASATGTTTDTGAAAGAGDAAAGGEAAGGVDAMAGNNAPGTGADAYKADDPFVAGNVKVADLPLTISAAGMAFTKQKFTAKPGQEWTFNNADIAIHNVQTDDAEKNPMKFKSPDANPGQKVKFKMPTKKGTYKVLCYYHQAMTATITVK